MGCGIRRYDVTSVRRVGRFTQTDPILGNRATKHYGYASNNPISNVDPLGLDDWRNDPHFYDAEKIALAESQQRVKVLESQLETVSSDPLTKWVWKTSGDVFDTGIGDLRLRIAKEKGTLKAAQQSYKSAMSGGSGLFLRQAAEMSLVNPLARITTGRSVTDPEHVQGVDRAVDVLNVLTVLGIAKVGPSLEAPGTTSRGMRLVAAEDEAVVASTPKGNVYSTAFEMKLNPADYGKSRSVHFNRANAALDAALQSDARFAQSMDTLIPGVGASVSSVGGRATPSGWVWHHAQEPGVMRLVPGDQHTPGSMFWDTLHQGGQGGYSRWAIPAGAPPN